MLRRFTLLICLAACIVPVAAHAQSSPFAPLPPAVTQPPAQTVTTSSTSTSDDDGLAAWQQVLIFAGGGILLIGIAWAIVSDARSNAPVEDEAGEAARVVREENRKRQKARNRAAAKRSRASRKRNR